MTVTAMEIESAERVSAVAEWLRDAALAGFYAAHENKDGRSRLAAALAQHPDRREAVRSEIEKSLRESGHEDAEDRAAVVVASAVVAAKKLSVLVLKCAAEMQPLPVEWLWQDRIALGTLSLLVGMPDLGKTLLAVWLAARVSRGDFDGWIERLCPSDPRFPAFDDFDLDFFEDTINGESRWWCSGRAQTDWARRVDLPDGLGKTKEEAAAQLRDNYERLAKRFDA